MSLTKIYLCDLCHEEITDGSGAGFFWTSSESGGFTLAPMTQAEGFHFCQICMNRLRDLMPVWEKRSW